VPRKPNMLAPCNSTWKIFSHTETEEDNVYSDDDVLTGSGVSRLVQGMYLAHRHACACMDVVSFLHCETGEKLCAC